MPKINIKLSDFEKWLNNLDTIPCDFSKTRDINHPYKNETLNLILAGFIGGFEECLRIKDGE